MIRLGMIFAVSLGVCAIAPAGDPAGPAGKSPASVENRVKESELTTIHLTPEAEKRLGITLVAAAERPFARPSYVPGEVVVPPGAAITVSAPIAGLIETAAEATLPRPGETVERGAPLLRLRAGEGSSGEAFTPADRISLARATADLTTAKIEAEGQLKQAVVRVGIAEIQLQRAQQLSAEGAGAQRVVDEAQAELDAANAQRAAVEDRLRTLERVLKSLAAGGAAEIDVVAPLGGTVRAAFVAPGQVVAAGAPLAEIVALDPIWVRVPVYTRELAAAEATNEIEVRVLGGGTDSRRYRARRVAAAESADPLVATVDLFFTIDNPDRALRPGERVVAAFPGARTDNSSQLVVPYAALLYDSLGGTWVYEATGPQTFVRRRIEVRDVSSGLVVVGRGLRAGAQVVTDGAVELFGTEFGAGK